MGDVACWKVDPWAGGPGAPLNLHRALLASRPPPHPRGARWSLRFQARLHGVSHHSGGGSRCPQPVLTVRQTAGCRVGCRCPCSLSPWGREAPSRWASHRQLVCTARTWVERSPLELWPLSCAPGGVWLARSRPCGQGGELSPTGLHKESARTPRSPFHISTQIQTPRTVLLSLELDRSWRTLLGCGPSSSGRFGALEIPWTSVTEGA